MRRKKHFCHYFSKMKRNFVYESSLEETTGLPIIFDFLSIKEKIQFSWTNNKMYIYFLKNQLKNIYVKSIPHRGQDYVRKVSITTKDLSILKNEAILAQLTHFNLEYNAVIITNTDDLQDAFNKTNKLLELQIGGCQGSKKLLFPLHLKKLTLGSGFNQDIELPNSLTYFNSSRIFAYPLELVPTLQSIYLKWIFSPKNYEQVVTMRNCDKFQLPENITELNLGATNPVIDRFPESIRYLDLGKNFNQEFKEFPKKLKSLNLGKYKLPLPKLNNELKTLSTSISNCTITEFPKSLEEIDFGMCWNHPIEKNGVSLLPDSLKMLTLSRGYSQLFGMLPSSLTILKIRNSMTLQCFMNGQNAYQKLQELYLETYTFGDIDINLKSITPNLQTIDIASRTSIFNVQLPESLKNAYFYVESIFNVNLYHLINLKILCIKVDKWRDLEFPKNLEMLNICIDENIEEKAEITLPTSLVSFELESDQPPFIHEFPVNLEKLSLRVWQWTREIKNLPSNLKSFKFTSQTTTQSKFDLPKTLQCISIDVPNFKLEQ